MVHDVYEFLLSLLNSCFIIIVISFFFWMQEEFAFYEVNDPFVQNFITSLDSILTSFKVCLHRLPSGLVS